MTWRLILAYLSCALGTTAGLMAASSPSWFGFVDVGSAGIPLPAFVSLPLVMLVGIVAYGIVIQLDRLPDELDEINYKAFLVGIIRSKSFVRAILVTPIVFLGIYLLVKDQPDLLLSHLIAFKNGFFWQVVLGRRVREGRDHDDERSQ